VKDCRALAFCTTLQILAMAACAPYAPGLPAAPVGSDEPAYVVLVSFDGMHPALLDRTPTPAFDRLAAGGVQAAGLIPVYPSKTFPNHYTIATGLYPHRHGLVDNSFYDPAFDATYRPGDSTAVRDGRWYGGEPIWGAATRQGVRTASFFWVGTEAPVRGVRPTYSRFFDMRVPNQERVDTVLHWLSLPELDRPRLVMLYFSEPDGAAHAQGAYSPAVKRAVTDMDRLLGDLLDGLAALPFSERIHVIVLSDHGIIDVPADNVIYLEDIVDLEGVRVAHNVTQALLYFDGDEDRLRDVYATLREGLHHATVYLPHELPELWRYGDNPRIGNMVVAAEPGWIIRRRGGLPWPGGGMHGWDPHLPAMHGIFMASGPGLRAGRTGPAFESIHVHPLVAHLLGIEPAPDIDGRLDAVADLLAAPGVAR
jgi:predicted AlkP superfamily pyrophosphatase or phosphodiesterase